MTDYRLRPIRGPVRLPVAALLALLAALGALLGAPLVDVAHASVATELTARWNPSPPVTVTSGELVTGEFRVNLNDPDTGAAGSRDPLVVEVALQHGRFTTIPSLCRPEATALPRSAIIEGGTTLRCNLGRVEHGTAYVVAFGAMADGSDDDELRATVSTDGAPAVPLPPVPIAGVQGVEVTFDVNHLNGESAMEVVHPVLPFGIAVPVGASRLTGPIEFDVVIEDTAGASARSLLELVGDGCEPYDAAAGASIPVTSVRAPLPKTCSVTKTGPGVFHVTLDGYKSPAWTDAPKDSAAGPPLPTDRDFFAAGAITLQTSRVPAEVVHGAFAFDAVVRNVRATTAGGVALVEDWKPDNNSETRVFTLLGTGQIWHRGEADPVLFGGAKNALYGQGRAWDGTPTAVVGGTVMGLLKSSIWEKVPARDIPAGQRQTICSTVDSAADVTFAGRIAVDLGTLDPGSLRVQVSSARMDPKDFTCDDNAASWQDATLSDLGPVGADGSGTHGYGITGPGSADRITAIRISVDPSDLKAGETVGAVLKLFTMWTVNTAVEGADVWVLGSATDSRGTYLEHDDLGQITPTEGEKHPYTTSLRDEFRIAIFEPFVDKSVSTPNPETGDTVRYTIRSGLRMDANVGDPGDYTVTDTLPAGLRYVEGSADPAPDGVEPGADGATVLTWNYQEVPINVDQQIAYEAVVDVPVGTRTNTAKVTTKQRPGYVPTYANGGMDDAAIAVIRTGRTILTKASSQQTFALDAPDRWILTLKNDDPVVQEVTDVVDILPFNGDGRGSDFTGGFAIDDVTVGDDETVYYATADPKTLSPDPEATVNGALGKPSALWSTTKPGGKVTGIRIVGANLAIGAVSTYEITWIPTGAEAGDKYVNYAWARTTHTELRMVRAAGAAVLASPTRLQIDKATDAKEVSPGDTVTYTLTARNSGPTPARGVVVTDRPGFGLDPATVTAAKPSAGTWDAPTGTWVVGEMAPDAVETIEITVKVAADYDRSKPVRNAVVIGSPQHPAPGKGDDCVPNDRVEADTDQCDQVSVPPLRTRLALNKKVVAVNHPAGAPSGSVDWLIEVRNNGPHRATGVVVTEGLPSGVRSGEVTVTGSPSQGTWFSTAHAWRVGDLKVGQVEQIRLRTRHPVAELRDGVRNAASVSSPESPYHGGKQPNHDLDGDLDQFDVDQAGLSPAGASVLPATGGPPVLLGVGGLGAVLLGTALVWTRRRRGL